MIKELVTGIIRHVLTVLGGSLVTSGYIDDATLQAGVGAILLLIGIGWSIYEKTQRSRVVTADGVEVRKAETVVTAKSVALNPNRKG